MKPGLDCASQHMAKERVSSILRGLKDTLTTTLLASGRIPRMNEDREGECSVLAVAQTLVP